MAASETNYWKIGLFVAVGTALAVVSLFWLASQRLHRELLPAVTYFDESVQGLDIGAPVKMRGVTVGTVSSISFGPDQRLVEVHASIYADVMKSIGFPHTMSDWISVPSPEDLRIQLSSTGITGVKFLNVDFFDPESHPALELPFSPPSRYVPSTTSALKTLEQGLEDFLHRGPPLMAEVQKLAATTESRIAKLDAANLASRYTQLATSIQAKVDQLDVNALSEETTGFVREMRKILSDVQSNEGSVGLLVSSWGSVGTKLEAAIDEADLAETGRAVRQVVGEYGALAQAGRVVLDDLREDLREFGLALGALRDLASYLERDPGSLLRGRGEPRE